MNDTTNTATNTATTTATPAGGSIDDLLGDMFSEGGGLPSGFDATITMARIGPTKLGSAQVARLSALLWLEPDDSTIDAQYMQPVYISVGNLVREKGGTTLPSKDGVNPVADADDLLETHWEDEDDPDAVLGYYFLGETFKSSSWNFWFRTAVYDAGLPIDHVRARFHEKAGFDIRCLEGVRGHFERIPLPDDMQKQRAAFRKPGEEEKTSDILAMTRFHEIVDVAGRGAGAGASGVSGASGAGGFSADDVDLVNAAVVEIITSNGGKATAANVMQGFRGLPDSAKGAMSPILNGKWANPVGWMVNADGKFVLAES